MESGEDRPATQYLLALLLAVVAGLAGTVLYFNDSHVFLYFGDAAAHIVRARQFFDSQRPGIDNLGTVWLPLPHLLLIPFIAIDALFYTGIAGPVVGIPFLVGTGLLLSSIVRRLTGSRGIAFLSACLFGLNPNIVYMVLTPMNEPALFFFIALGGYAFLRWLDTEAERWLFASAASIALASLCRYEAWLLAPFLPLVAAGKGLSRVKGGIRPAAMLLAAALSGAGVALWLLWNLIEYGDALKFARWTYSVAPTAVRDYLQQRPLDVPLLFGRAILTIFGPVVLIFAAAAVIPLRHLSAQRRSLLVLLYFKLPVLFALGAVLAGFVQVDEWWWNWRYVLTIGLLLPVAAGIGLSEFFRRVPSVVARAVAVVALLAMPLVQLTIPSVGVPTFYDASKGFYDRTYEATDLGEELRCVYTGGGAALLTGYSQAQRIMLSSRLPLKDFHIIYDPREKDLYGPLWESDRYLVIGKRSMPESKGYVDYWLSRREVLADHYDIRLENESFLLLERKQTGTSDWNSRMRRDGID